MTGIAWRLCRAFHTMNRRWCARTSTQAFAAERMTIEREGTMADSATVAELTARIERLQSQWDRATDTLRRLVDEAEELKRELAAAREEVTYRKRPPILRGRTVQTNVGGGPLYVMLNEDDRGRPFEAFFTLGKSGSSRQSYL